MQNFTRAAVLLCLVGLGCSPGHQHAKAASSKAASRPGSDAAVGTPGVGDKCLPEQVPDMGFDDRETYLETSSAQCETQVCIVYRLRGDPRPDCVPRSCPSMGTCIPSHCSSAADVSDRIYCSCRCDNGGADASTPCTCPSGFSCVDVLDQGAPGIRGGYCVKTSTVNQ